jgi:DNA-binding NtrC family response regulator
MSLMNANHVSISQGGQKAETGFETGEFAAEAVRGPWLIECREGTGPLRKATLERGASLVLGSGRDVDVHIEDACVSGRHCRLDASGGTLELIDLDSKNGVFLGNARVRRARLPFTSAVFTIGRTLVAVKTITTDVAAHSDGDCAVPGLVGRSAPIVRLSMEIRRLARLKAPVLIVGESGVGKDVVARALHELSGRRGAYVPLNVATIPESLADSELFGHRRGAFTGAVQQQTGAFEEAHSGTLFLDEIGELALSVQAKLLRVLEDGMVKPVGAVQARRVDVRIVSATCAPLNERCSTGEFRFDLLQRLSMVTLRVPPLRDRRSDIPLLARAWLDRFCDEVGFRLLSDEAIELLGEYEWPGNVRQLGAVLYRACVCSDHQVLDIPAIEHALADQVGTSSKRRNDPREFLRLAEGNISRAARLAGLPRTTYRTWLSRVSRADEKDGETA